MTHRNYNWSPLGVPGDPIPGDPSYVSRQASAMRTSGDAMHSAARNLRRLEAPDTCSEAIAKIMAESTKTASLLEQAGTRYRSAADALAGYAPKLGSAQAESLAALQSAGPAQSNERAEHQRSVDLYWQAVGTLDPAERAHAVTEYKRASARRAQATAELSAAKARLRDAIADRDSAAAMAADAIDAASDAGDLNDSAWDKFTDFIQPVVDAVAKAAKWVWDNIDMIALVLTIAAVAFSWVPVVGQVLAALALAARVLSAVKAAYTLYEGVAEGMRTGNWGRAAMGAAGLALSFVGGKVVGAVASRVGAVAGKGVTRAVTKVLSARNDRLAAVALVKFHKVRVLVDAAHGTRATSSNAIGEMKTTPYYFKSAGAVDQVHRAANAGVRDLASKTDALMSTVKGSDYSKPIQDALEDLVKHGGHHDISQAMIDEIAGSLGEASAMTVEELVTRYGEGRVEEAAQWVDSQQKQLESHRLTSGDAR